MWTAPLCGLIVTAALAPPCASAAEHWEIQFFHDENKSSLTLNDIRFTSPARGLAIGALIEKGDAKPVSLVTTDGGANWTTHKAPDVGRSLFCLDDAACWMAAASGVWFSTEGGRDWRRILKRNSIARVYFTSRDRGYAIGAEKTLLETSDGGRHWTDMPVREQVKTNPERTVFYAIDFDGKNGTIAGRSEPRDPESSVPLWMDPDAEKRRERPSISLVIDSHDGGATWKAGTASMFGRIIAVELGRDDLGLALIEFDRYFAFPSELFLLNFRTGASTRVLRQEHLAITDIALLESGPAFAAGFEPVGKLASVPIPGKVKIVRSSDLQHWAPMDVDYRAVAHRVSITALDENRVWAATDTGMILRLVKQ